MALPPQRLVNDDLFIVNRITANDVDTYKVSADDIGVFLLEAPVTGGGNQDDKFINDGEINIYGNLPNVGASHLNLHSANEYCEGKLSFDEGFHITGQHMDVLITHDYATLAKELSCDDGGIDGTTTCLKLDMNWLSDHVVCGNSGLEANGSCIGINLCDEHSGLTFRGNGCLEVNICPSKGIMYHEISGCLQVDLNYLTNSLSCDGLRPSQGNSDATCMEIDMEWLTDNIRCNSAGNSSAYGGSGLIDNGGCLQVDPCWVNDQLNSGNPQYLITDYDATSIDTDNCKLRVNEAWLLQWAKDNIQDVVIHDNALCMEIDGNQNLFEGEVVINLPENCMKVWTEGVIDNKIKNIKVAASSSPALYIHPLGTGNQNVAQGEVALKLDESLLKDLIVGEIDKRAITKITGDACIEVVNGGGPEVQIKFKTSCGGGGGTGPGPAPNDGKLTIKKGDNGIRFMKKDGSNFTSVNEITHSADTADDGVFKIDVDPEACPDWNVSMSGNRMFLKASGGAKNPSLVLGSKAAYDGLCIDNDVKPDGSCKHGRLAWLGVSSNQQNGSFTCHRGIEGWKDITNCGGSPQGEVDILFSVAAGTKVAPHHGSAGIISSNSKLAEDVRVFRYNNFGGDNLVGGPPEQNQYNRLSFRKTTFLRGQITELSRSTDSRVNINIDNIIDTFGGYADDPDVTDGIFRWGIKPMDEYSGHQYPFLFIDPDELGARLPAFVDYTPDSTAWEPIDSIDEETGEVIDTDMVLKDDFDPATQLEVGAINWQALHAVAIAAIAKHKKRIDVLESREGMLNVLGIVEYNNETAAGNSGLGQGEVYWDLELNRMRAVT